MQVRVIILLVFALIVAVFAVMNTQSVVVDFLVGQTEVQLIFVIIFSILFGAFSMLIISSMKQIQLSRKIKAVEKENASIKEELEQLTKVNLKKETSTKAQLVKEETEQGENTKTETKEEENSNE